MSRTTTIALVQTGAKTRACTDMQTQTKEAEQRERERDRERERERGREGGREGGRERDMCTKDSIGRTWTSRHGQARATPKP